MTRLLLASLLCAATSTSLVSTSGHAETLNLPTKPILTLAAARIVVDAAERDATRRGTPGVIAVVDDGGNMLITERMDGATIASTLVAPGKARTAALFRAPSKNYENTIAGGRQAIMTAGLNMMSGGEPIVVNGQVVGAVGVSTATAPNDDLIATTAAHALDESK
ncbi:heme-binding protein [Robbsia sp. KACC 23696]|uniref:GlcG/HbpS family heme-binding protein n=1 Tax=Robbsia sp. KACC 23696 TaxID=3149231 RepID=UPI00325A8E13